MFWRSVTALFPLHNRQHLSASLSTNAVCHARCTETQRAPTSSLCFVFRLIPAVVCGVQASLFTDTLAMSVYSASHSEVSLVSWHLWLKPRTLQAADCIWRVNLQVRLVGTTWFSESMMQPGVVFFRGLLRSSWRRCGFSPVFTSSSNFLTLFLKIFTCSPMSPCGQQCPHDSYGVLMTSLSHVWVKTQQ